MGTPLGWHRRQALALGSQLPDNITDALLVIEALKELVDGFLVGHPEEDAPARPANVLPFGSKA